MLTSKQRELLNALRQYVDYNHISPTIDELAQELKISHTAAYSRMQYLIFLGFVGHRPHKARSYVIRQDGDEVE